MWLVTYDSNSDKVDYGLSNAYGSSDSSPQIIPAMEQHIMELTGLSADTEYHYKVTSVTDNGDAVSSDRTFRTLINDPHIDPVIVEGPSVIYKGNGKAVVTWKTDQYSTSRVWWSSTSSVIDNFPPPPEPPSTLGDANFVLEHTLKVDGLVEGTTYHFKVRSTDMFGNEVYSEKITITPGTTPTIDIIEGPQCICGRYLCHNRMEDQ